MVVSIGLGELGCPKARLCPGLDSAARQVKGEVMARAGGCIGACTVEVDLARR